MGYRLTWTNNSQGHTGTHVYLADAPMDPQALPAPVGTADPVAQGAQAEFTSATELADGTYYFRVQDFDGAGVGEVSAEVSLEIASTFAITFVGADSPDGVSSGQLSETLTVPAGTVSGDLLVMSISHAGTLSFDAGTWTLAGKSANFNNSSYPIYNSCYHIEYDGAFSSVTVSQTSAGTEHMSVSLAAYHPEGGSLQVTELVDQGVTVSGSNLAPLPDFTATAGGLVVLAGAAKITAPGASYDPPTGWGKRSVDGGYTRDLIADTPSVQGEEFVGLEWYPKGTSGDPAHVFVLQLVAS